MCLKGNSFRYAYFIPLIELIIIDLYNMSLAKLAETYTVGFVIL